MSLKFGVKVEFKEIYNVKVSKCGIVLSEKGYKFKQTDNGRGYLIVSVKINGKKTSKGVHRLVAEAWLENPLNLSDVNHIDTDRYNNHADNLEWMAHGKNIEYSYKTKKRSATGENNARAKITSQAAIQICELLAQGFSAKAVADRGFDYGRVISIKRRQNWKHISKDYVW